MGGKNMSFKFLVVAIIFFAALIICIYFKKEKKTESIIYTISVSFVAAVLSAIFIPNGISIFDIFCEDDGDTTTYTEEKNIEPIKSITEENISTIIETQEISTTNPPETNPIETTTSTNLINVSVKLDANGGSVYPSKIMVDFKSSYFDIPTPQRDYHTFLGWYTSPDGGNIVYDNTIVNNPNSHTLYAHWKYNEVSEWVSLSQVPSNADIVDRKWTYTLTETKESTNSSEAGWIQTGSYWKSIESISHEYADFPTNRNGYEYYDASDQYFKKYNNDPDISYEYADSKRVLIGEQIKSYIYYQWAYKLTGTFSEGDRFIGTYRGEKIFNNEGVYRGLATEWDSFEGEYIEYNSKAKAYKKEGESEYSYWWVGRIPVYIQTYTDYIKVCEYKKETQEESNIKVTESDSISNVQELVRYQVK